MGVENNQEVAYKLASHLLKAKSDRRAAKEFSRIPIENTSRRERKKFARKYLRGEEVTIFNSEQLIAIRARLEKSDQEYLQNKEGKFGKKDRVILLLKAKGGRFSGMNASEREEMYRDVGYTDDEIKKITGKKLLFSAGVTTGLAWSSLGARGVGAAYEKIVPFIEHIPDNKQGYAVALAIAINIGSYALLCRKNLQLTQQIGVGSDITVSSIYHIGDKLFPDKMRDRIAVGLPIAYNLVAQVRDMAAIGTITGNSDKMIASSVMGTAFNAALICGCEIFRRYKGKKEKAKGLNL